MKNVSCGLKNPLIRAVLMDIGRLLLHIITGVVSLPLRYMHTPAEVIDLRSAEAVAELIAAWVVSFGEED